MSAETIPALQAAASAVVSPRRVGMPWWAAPLVAVIAIAAMVCLRLILLPNQITPIGYGVPLVAFLWLRNRRWLWIATVAFAVISLLEIFVVIPTNQAP